MRGIKYDILKKFNELCSEYLCKLCSEMEEGGYDFFYPSEEDVREFYNGEFFDKYGNII